MNRRNFLAASTMAALCLLPTVFSSAQQPVAKNAIKIYFKDIHCEGCAKKIRSRLFTVVGVGKVETSVKQDLAIVTPVQGKTVSAQAIWESLDQGKFDVDRMETPDGILTEKPAS